MMKKTFFFSVLQVATGPDIKTGSGRHWGALTDSCHVRKGDGDGVPPTQRTEIWTPVMILSSSHHRKQHPVTGVPSKHTSTRQDRCLLPSILSPHLRIFDVWIQSVAPNRGIYVKVGKVQPSKVVWMLTIFSAFPLRGFLSSCTLFPFHTSTIEDGIEILAGRA